MLEVEATKKPLSLKALLAYRPVEGDRIWLWVYRNKTPIYPIFYLLKGDYNP